MIWLPTAVMQSDPMTKNLGKVKFAAHKPEMTGAACAAASASGKLVGPYQPYPGVSRTEKAPKKKRTVAYLKSEESTLWHQVHALQSVAPWSQEEQALVKTLEREREREPELLGICMRMWAALANSMSTGPLG